MTKLFGTDGIRGIANKELTPELAYKVARASAKVLAKGKTGKVVIGKDTRKSGDMLEAALIAGLNSMGIDVLKVGVVPTPAISYLIREHEALFGVVISASHNPGEYNGIKLFDGDGLKLRDKIELEIEEYILNKDLEDRKIGKNLGQVKYDSRAGEQYKNYLKETIGVDLSGYKIVVDCGHGALYKIAPELIKELNGELILVNNQPDGMNINDNCGSTNPQITQDLVVKNKADIGISFDGDGDRIIAVDDKGRIVDGDHIIGICAVEMKKEGRLSNDTVVGTIMTNMGLDNYLQDKGIDVVRTKVGDSYILEEMLMSDYSLGGEQSGHIIFLDYNTTGDGLATALYLLRIMVENKVSLSELNEEIQDYPQVLVNARVDENKKYAYMENEIIRKKIEEIEEYFHGSGRVVIRPSGTEPLVRVMIEANKEEGIDKIAKELASLIEENL